MRNNRPSRRSGRSLFSRLFQGPSNPGVARKAPRRRDVERLEERQMMTANPTTNPYFANQWYLLATGQPTEFDTESPTFTQTTSIAGNDLNVLGAWAQTVFQRDSAGNVLRDPTTNQPLTKLATGTGIQVAIIDGGFDLSHEDLVFITTGLTTNLDLLGNDGLPGFEDTTDFTGTALAGLVGARDNALGIVGVAHGADLYPVRLVPGAGDVATPTIDAINSAFRFQAGFLQDTNGDGVPDALLGGALVPIDVNGDGVADGLGQDPSRVTDVFLHSGRFLTTLSREATPLPEGPSTVNGQTISIAEALRDTALGGRATWVDADNDGFLDPGEIVSLGSIHVVPTGNNNGRAGTTNPFDPEGLLQSSQYNALANSIYAISVGAIDYDGKYENPATGNFTGYSEGGANVLVVAYSGNYNQDLSSSQELNSGIVTTDITGEGGANVAPIFNFEFDNDFFADTNYTSAFGAGSGVLNGTQGGGTEAAAAQVAGVIALMLEANPRLSYRDVQQIIMMSAQQNDQFNESWITNQLQEFYDPENIIPDYAIYTVEDAQGNQFTGLLPNAEIDPATGDFILQRGFFLPGGGVINLGAPWQYDETMIAGPFVDGAAVGVTLVGSNLGDPARDPDPLVLFQPGATFGNTVINLINPAVPFQDVVPLEFENGAGFTVSWGYGRNLEEVTYGHGVVDAALAVKLALAWETYDLYLDEQITITSGQIGGTAGIRVQGQVSVNDAAGNLILTVPGGIAGPGVNINPAFYQQFSNSGITTTDINDAAGTPVASIITQAPFFNSGDVPASNRGVTRIPLEFDPSILDDYLSIEWIEFTTQVQGPAGADIDNLRISIVSPDGTQSELNPYREEAGADQAPQLPQWQQGRIVPFFESIDDNIGLVNINSQNDVITGTELQQVGSVGSDESLSPGTAWTWTSNRHWGELFSAQANDGDAETGPDGASRLDNDQWFLVLENHGTTEIVLGGLTQVTIHGTKATGNRIQGKIGIDDNKQQIAGTDNDENFNFERHVELAQIQVSLSDGSTRLQTVVLDDASDSVTYTDTNTPAPGRFSLDRIYKTKTLPNEQNESVEIYYPVIDRDAYFNFSRADFILNGGITDPVLLDSLSNFYQQTEDPSLTADIILDYVTKEEPLFGASLGTAPEPTSYRNFDYSQESFASAVTVAATQYATSYDLAGNSVRAATGQVKYFTTGADGNYYFDVKAAPEPPRDLLTGQVAVGTPAYNDWVVNYGTVYDYEISLVDVDPSRILTNADGGGVGYFDVPSIFAGEVEFSSSNLKYTVEIYSAPAFETGATTGDNPIGTTTKITNVNFLLEVDPALTNVTNAGKVYRDRNGDGVQQAGLEESVAGVVVYHDADGDGVLDAGEANSTTAADGTYSFVIAGLNSPQNVLIRIDTASIPSTLEPLNPATGAELVSVTPGQTATTNFTVRRIGGEPAQVVGVVFEDIDQDGVRDAGEVGFADTLPAQVYIDLNGNGVLDSGEPSDFTDASGQFLIESESTGSFTVRMIPPAAQILQTAPAAGAGVSVTLVAGQTLNLGSVFGLFDGRILDFGDLFKDASSNFPTLLADNGARHVVIPGIRLGANNDIDTDGFQNPVRNPLVDGLGDDFSGLDDEDGVRLSPLTPIAPGALLQFQVEAYGAGAVLNAWIDFNNDGDWDDAGEKIFNNLEDIQVGSANLAQKLQVTAPANVNTSAAFYAARFRWGPAGISYDGVANAGEVEDYLIPNVAPIVITGNVRNDIDGDGVFEGTDAALAGIRVFVDRDLDGVLDADEPRAVTDASGAYRVEINSTTPLNVTLRLDNSTLPAGLLPRTPADGIFNETIAASGSATSNFLVAAPQGVSGVVFNDLDNDGVRDGGEGGFAGILVEVLRDADSNGSFETLVTSATTSSTGAYTLPLAAVGQYQVRVNLTGLQFVTQSLPTANAARTVNVTTGVFATVGDFGVHDAVPTFTLDYGDLRVGGGQNFPTTLADNGARHTRVAGVRLGAVAPDADPGTSQSANATADDNLFGDDEDGVVMASSVVAGSNVLIDVTATGTAADRLHAWIDFNNDGDWNDAGEQITAAGGLGLTSGATTQLVINTAGIAIDATATAYAARFRWGQGITGFTGLASTGEVEDYLLPRVLGTQGGVLDADFNGDGTVDLLDLDVLGANFGAGPGATAAQGDANGDGSIDLLDLDILGSEFGQSSSASFALATAGPALSVYLEPIAFEASAFGALVLPTVAQSIAVDESLAVEGESILADDAVDAALLQWALLGAGEDDDDAEPAFSLVEDEVPAEEDELLSLALAF